VKAISTRTPKAGTSSVRSSKGMRVIGLSISNPTKISAGPYACGGMAEMNGAKNKVPAKHSAVMTAVRPVRPPASTPVADPIEAPDVVVPITAAKVVASASAIIGRSICGRLPSLSRKPARADTPISVPMVSTKAITKIVRTTGKNPQVNRLCRSSWKNKGCRLGGRLTQPLGAGAAPVTKLRRAVARTPLRIAAGKRRMLSTVISRNPRMESRTESEVRWPGRSQGNNAGLVQPDEGEKQSDADGVAVTERGGNGVDHPLPEAEQSHQNKKNSGQEHRAQSALPSVAKHMNHGERDESVFTHIRTDGERAVGIEAHQQRSEDDGKNGGCKRGVSWHAGGFQDG